MKQPSVLLHQSMAPDKLFEVFPSGIYYLWENLRFVSRFQVRITSARRLIPSMIVSSVLYEKFRRRVFS